MRTADAILGALELNGSLPYVYVAHDLDNDNRRLIEDGRLSHVLHHDLQTVFHAFVHHHKVSPNPVFTTMSPIQVVTPENIPPQNRRL